MTFKASFAIGLLLALLGPSAHATGNMSSPSNKVIVSGRVPDDASRRAILARLRDVYGAERIEDRLETGGVTASPIWSEQVLKALDSGIRQIRQGQLQIGGSQVSIAGEVANEASRQQIARDIAAAMGPAYSVANGLRTGSGGEQQLLDQTLGDRVVEFESGSAILTPAGVHILDEMAAAISGLEKARIEIIGHTDSSGNRLSNVSLSLARADTVKAYLTAKGIAASALVTHGVGPDRPVTSNDSQEGRARNRRIEFRLLQ